MSNTIVVTQKPIQTKKEEDSWQAVGKALGYPDSWIALIKQSLAKEGKNFEWQSLPSGTSQSESQQ